MSDFGESQEFYFCFFLILRSPFISLFFSFLHHILFNQKYRSHYFTFLGRATMGIVQKSNFYFERIVEKAFLLRILLDLLYIITSASLCVYEAWWNYYHIITSTFLSGLYCLHWIEMKLWIWYGRWEIFFYGKLSFCLFALYILIQKKKQLENQALHNLFCPSNFVYSIFHNCLVHFFRHDGKVFFGRVWINYSPGFRFIWLLRSVIICLSLN